MIMDREHKRETFLHSNTFASIENTVAAQGSFQVNLLALNE